VVLNKKSILAAIDSGRLKIVPYDRKLVRAASIKLTLAELYLADRWPHRLDSRKQPPRPPAEGALIVPKRLTRPYELGPGDRVIAGTRERITLSADICAEIRPRARTTALGLNLDIAPGFIQPGTKEEQLFFAIRNPGHSVVVLHPRHPHLPAHPESGGVNGAGAWVDEGGYHAQEDPASRHDSWRLAEQQLRAEEAGSGGRQRRQ
jgi:deoxycytidine triphosphate deaminase